MDADDARGDQRRWFEFKGYGTKGNIFTFDCTNSVKSGNVNWILEGKKKIAQFIYPLCSEKKKGEKLLITSSQASGILLSRPFHFVCLM